MKRICRAAGYPRLVDYHLQQQSWRVTSMLCLIPASIDVPRQEPPLRCLEQSIAPARDGFDVTTFVVRIMTPCIILILSSAIRHISCLTIPPFPARGTLHPCYDSRASCRKPCYCTCHFCELYNIDTHPGRHDTLAAFSFPSACAAWGRCEAEGAPCPTVVED